MVRRPAFIRLDSLVALAVIVILTGLLVRTVQKVRDSSARAESRTHIEQIRPAPRALAARHESSGGEEPLDLAAQAGLPQRGGLDLALGERSQP
jgi:hypothetical protein